MRSIESFLKKHRISNIYRYAEVSGGSPSEILFGWVTSDSIDLNSPVVLSYPSASKKFSKDTLEWSNNEGVSAIGIFDYHKYFYAITGLTPDEFWETWDGKLSEFIKQSDLDGEKTDLEYVYYLARLLSFGDRFILGGRIFKLVNTEA